MIGNPFVVWSCLAGVISFVLINAWRKRYSGSGPVDPVFSRVNRAGWYCFLGYVFNLLPYLGVTRQAFVYHYMPALYYAAFVTGAVLQLSVPTWALDKVVFPVFIALTVAAFLYWCPWVYALGIPNEAHTNRRWFSSWD